MTTKIGSKAFSGLSHVFDGTLADAVRASLQAHARRVVASLSDITDNGGGTNDVGGLRKPVAFPAFQAGTTDAVAKTEFEASCGAVRDAISELIAQTNTIRAKVPAFSALTDSTGGAAADGTIAAIDDSMTGTSATGATMVSRTGANTVFGVLNDRIEQLRYYINQLLTALGMSTIATELSRSSFSTTFAAISTSTGTATGGTNTGADATISKAAADAALDILTDNVKTLSTALNSMTADANANAALAAVAVA